MGIVYLMVGLFAPVFNEADRVAESYFEMFESAINDADYGRSASFFMLDNGRDDLNFYVVYFGGVVSFENSGGQFIYKGDAGDNVLCVCSGDGENIVCRHCDDMDLPVKLNREDGQWVVGEGVRIKLLGDKTKYDFISDDIEKVEKVEEIENDGVDDDVNSYKVAP